MSFRKKRNLFLSLAFILFVILLFLFASKIINFNFQTARPIQFTALPSFSTIEPTTILNSDLLTDSPSPTETIELPKPLSFPDSSNYEWTLFAAGFERPIDLAHANDGSGRLFIVEQSGVIRIWVDGKIIDQAFLDIRTIVGSAGNEQGLLGIAFHPDYLLNGYFYLNYTDLKGSTRISRFQVSANPNIADPASEYNYLEISQPYTNHNGGGMAFGPDGFLYAGLGDGGLAGDPHNNAQDPNSYLGKLIRFDVDQEAEPEIWASGLRNPWRFSFDTLTGDLYLADVGQNEFEEVNFLPAGTRAGSNFGWDYYEGIHTYESNPPGDFVSVFPLTEYDHQTGGCSVTGGFVYRGSELPEWQGIYFYGDYCTGNVWGLFQNSIGEWENELLFELEANISSFGLDQVGEIYLLDLFGNIFKLQKN